MPDQYTRILNKLQGIFDKPEFAYCLNTTTSPEQIKELSQQIKAERKLTIERWLRTYIGYVDYFKDKKSIDDCSGKKFTHDQFDFLIDIFKDEKCWSGNRFNNTALGEALISEKRGGVENPIGSLGKLELAARYCKFNELDSLWEKAISDSERINQDEDTETSKAKDEATNRVRRAVKRNYPVAEFCFNNLKDLNVKEYSHIQYSKLREYPLKAAELDWQEGVETFLQALKNGANANLEYAARKTFSYTLDNAHRKLRSPEIFNALVSALGSEKALDMVSNAKKTPEENSKRMSHMLCKLISGGYFDMVDSLAQNIKPEMISPYDYGLISSVLSDEMLECSVFTRSKVLAIMQKLWSRDDFLAHKKSTLEQTYETAMDNTVDSLVITWKNHDVYDAGRLATDIMQFAKQNCSSEDYADFRHSVVSEMRNTGKPNKGDIGLKNSKDLVKELEDMSLQRQPQHQHFISGNQVIAQLISPVAAFLHPQSPSGSLSDTQAHGRGDQKPLDRK